MTTSVRDAHTVQEWIEPSVPAFRLITTCHRGRYRIEKEILTR